MNELSQLFPTSKFQFFNLEESSNLARGERMEQLYSNSTATELLKPFLQVTKFLCASGSSSELDPVLLSRGHMAPKRTPLAALQHLTRSIHLQLEWFIGLAHLERITRGPTLSRTLFPLGIELPIGKPNSTAHLRAQMLLGSGDQTRKLPLLLWLVGTPV